MKSSPDVLNVYAPHRPRGARLSPEEDALIIDGDGDIDETLPADLWFRTRQRREISAAGGARVLSTGR